MQFREEKLQVLTQGSHKHSPSETGMMDHALSPVFFLIESFYVATTIHIL